MPWPLYHYRATVHRLIDGDSGYLDIDFGAHLVQTWDCRMLGINADELHDPDPDVRANAVRAQHTLADRLTGKTFYVKTELDKDDKYGRLLVVIYEHEDDDVSLNRRMVEWGLAHAEDNFERV